ncbi:MAG: dipeptidase [Pseudolabrys sp.]|nr:dipeptidase [Pseudolabrys sp.]MCW5684409.1 dipeptidase [Pseudolabrys sp.]
MLIDGLQCGHFDRAVLEQLNAAGVGCVTITLGFWEGAIQAMEAVGRWRDLERENADVMGIAYNAAQIEAIHKSGRIAVLLGFQNATLFDSRIRFVELFADMGVRCVQLTYNNQNDYGGSCYEAEDSGLSRFGRELVLEMNRAGILVDLSHVGNRTTLDAVKYSKKPVAVTHANADSLFPHKRNKTDDVLRALKDNGGVIGCACYRNITGDDYCSTVDRWCDMIKRTVDIAGIDHVAIGTDRSHHHGPRDYDWMRRGQWTRGIDYGAGSAARPGKVPPADWFQELSGIGTVEPALRRAGFSDAEADKIANGNWLRVYRAVFGDGAGPATPKAKAIA